MKGFALRVAVMVIRAVAAFIELFVKCDNGIVLISCQDDHPTRDILDLAEAICRLPDAPLITVMAGRMERNIGGAFSFVGRMFSMLKQIASARVVVVDAYCPAVSIPKKRHGRIVVQIWHAPDAIKKFSLQILDTNAGYGSKTAMILYMHKGYDYILCPSDATRPFFSEAFGYPDSAFVKYGLPSLDRVGLMKRPLDEDVYRPERAAVRDAICEKYPILTKDRTLIAVYAPTFRDGIAADVGGLALALQSAAKKVSLPTALIFKPHPLDKAFCGVDKAKCNNKTSCLFSVIADTDFSLIDWYAAADAVITDYSGAAIETAAAGVASYYYVYDIDDYAARRGLNIDLRNEAICKYAFASADLLSAQIVRDFAAGEQGKSYDYDSLAAFASKYLETPLSGNADRLAHFIAEL